MPQLWRPCVLGLVVLALCACSDDDKKSKDPDPKQATPSVQKAVDCSWIEQSNCWTQAVTQMTACRSAQHAIGRFSSKRNLCQMDDGTILHFQGPVLLPNANTQAGPDLHFAIEHSHTICGSLNLTASTVDITMAKGQKTSLKTTFQGLTIVCPDGLSYGLANADAAHCASDHLPGIQTNYTPSSLTILLNGASDLTGPLFACSL